MKNVIINGQHTTYFITDDGRLFNETTQHWYKGSNQGGYLKYDLTVNGKRCSKLAHRLVAEAYLDQPEKDNYVINHKDGNKLNNNVSNLEWVSVGENNQAAYDLGLKARTNGVFKRQKYTGDLPDEIWKQYENTNYYVSNRGRARNIVTGNLMQGKINNKGYKEWCFSINGKKRTIFCHRLVYQLFGSEPLQESLVINHIDGDKANCDINNLEQISRSENVLHACYVIGAKNIRKVGKYSLDDELLEVYDSCAAAARANEGCFPNLISVVCNGKAKSHHGYIWKYIEE